MHLPLDLSTLRERILGDSSHNFLYFLRHLLAQRAPSSTTFSFPMLLFIKALIDISVIHFVRSGALKTKVTQTLDKVAGDNAKHPNT